MRATPIVASAAAAIAGAATNTRAAPIPLKSFDTQPKVNVMARPEDQAGAEQLSTRYIEDLLRVFGECFEGFCDPRNTADIRASGRKMLDGFESLVSQGEGQSSRLEGKGKHPIRMRSYVYYTPTANQVSVSLPKMESEISSSSAKLNSPPLAETKKQPTLGRYVYVDFRPKSTAESSGAASSASSSSKLSGLQRSATMLEKAENAPVVMRSKTQIIHSD